MSHFTNPFANDPANQAVTDTVTVDTAITNSTATEDTSNRYNICQRTGFKVKPGSLMKEWNGALVRSDSYEPRNIQDFVKGKAESLTGAIRPEADDQFIATSIAPEDL
jgi:hypothetical protein